MAKPSPENPSGFGRWLLVLAAGLVVVSVLGYRVVIQNNASPADTAVTTTPEPAATATEAATDIAEPAPAASAAEPAASAAEPAASAAEPATSAAEPAPATDAPAGSASAKPTPSPAPSASAAPATDIRRVTVKSKPPKVRFFHFGKPVGVTPFVLEFKPGERHAYEAGLPGYGTRKVVIDGSKPVVIVGLTREKP